MPGRLICRARVAAGCYHGSPLARYYEYLGPEEDGTWDGHSVVCDACYIALGAPTASDPRMIAQRPSAVGQRGTAPGAARDKLASLGRVIAKVREQLASHHRNPNPPGSPTES